MAFKITGKEMPLGIFSTQKVEEDASGPYFLLPFRLLLYCSAIETAGSLYLYSIPVFVLDWILELQVLQEHQNIATHSEMLQHASVLVQGHIISQYQ